MKFIKTTLAVCLSLSLLSLTACNDDNNKDVKQTQKTQVEKDKDQKDQKGQKDKKDQKDQKGQKDQKDQKDKKGTEINKKQALQREVELLEESIGLDETTPKVLGCRIELPKSKDGGIVFEWTLNGLRSYEKNNTVVITKHMSSTTNGTLILKAKYNKTSDIFITKTYPIDLSKINETVCNDQDMIVEENKKIMFTQSDDIEIVDGQPILYNNELRGFDVNNLLEFTITEDKKLRLRNILPHTFKDVTLFANVKSSGEKIKLKTFSTIEPFVFANFTFNLGELGLDKSDINKDNISFELESSDPMVAKIKKITIPTRYQIGLYGKWNDETKQFTNQRDWERMFAEDAKNFIPIIANMSFVLSSQEFADSVRNADFEFSNNCKHQKDGTIPNNGRCVKLNPEDIIKKFTSVKQQNIGFVTNGQGQAVGKIFGIAKGYINNPTNIFYNYNVKGMEEDPNIRDPLEVYAHEFAHVCGYGHNGNMTYIGNYVYPNGDISRKDERKLGGMSALIGYLYQDFLLKEKLPFNSYPYNDR